MCVCNMEIEWHVCLQYFQKVVLVDDGDSEDLEAMPKEDLEGT